MDRKWLSLALGFTAFAHELPAMAIADGDPFFCCGVDLSRNVHAHQTGFWSILHIFPPISQFYGPRFRFPCRKYVTEKMWGADRRLKPFFLNPDFLFGFSPVLLFSSAPTPFPLSFAHGQEWIHSGVQYVRWFPCIFSFLVDLFFIL